MTAPSADDVRLAILRAWQASVPPPPDRISATTYDDEGVGAYFRGRTFEGHEVAALRYHSVGLSFFTPEAFAYYLPAYLLAVLKDRETADTIYDSIFFHLSPKQLGMQWADSYRARIAGFTEEQKQAIGAYLAWCAAPYEEAGSSLAEVDQILAYLAGGEVQVAASPTARLLQLGGCGDRAPADIRWLSLSNTKVSDGELAGLFAFTALIELDLGRTELTDSGLSQLSEPAIAAALANLEKLDLSGDRQLSAEGLRHLAALRKLTELRLSNCDLDDARLQALAPLQLRRLNLVHARGLTDAGFCTLDVSALEKLEMFGVDATEQLLARLGDAGTLRVLECRSASDAGLIALCKNRALVQLDLSSASAVGEAGLAALAALPALQSLKLHELTCASWPAGFPALTELTLLSGELSAEGAEGLAGLPGIIELKLFGVRLARGALGHLARLRSLRRLTLFCQDLDDEKFLELAGSPVQQLAVHQAPLRNAALSRLGELPELRELQLDGLAMDDGAMDLLPRAGRLHTLQLAALPISDSGLARLARCTELRSLQLSGTRVTAAGIAALRRAAPELEIVGV